MLGLAGDFGFDLMEHDIVDLMTTNNASLFTVAGLRSAVEPRLASDIMCDSLVMERRDPDSAAFWDVVCWNSSLWEFLPSFKVYSSQCHARLFLLDAKNGPLIIDGAHVSDRDSTCELLWDLFGLHTLDVVTGRTAKGQPRLSSRWRVHGPQRGHTDFGPFVSATLPLVPREGRPKQPTGFDKGEDEAGRNVHLRK